MYFVADKRRETKTILQCQGMRGSTELYELVSSVSAHCGAASSVNFRVFFNSEIVCRNSSSSQLNMKRDAGYDQIFGGSINFPSYKAPRAFLSLRNEIEGDSKKENI